MSVHDRCGEYTPAEKNKMRLSRETLDGIRMTGEY